MPVAARTRPGPREILGLVGGQGMAGVNEGRRTPLDRAVRIDTSPVVHADPPRLTFARRSVQSGHCHNLDSHHRRPLMTADERSPPSTGIWAVLNWVEELRGQVSP